MISKLYAKMKNNPNLVGTFRLEENASIEWKFSDSYTIHIAQDYIGIYRFLFKKIPESITHWHPEDDEIFDYVCALGTKGNVTVVKTSWFFTGVLYMGPASDCPYYRKWLFGKYYYLYAK